MSDRPLVSVILPCFNAESYVAEALESLQRQTYPWLEIVVLDDGSSDRTYEIAERRQVDDARIRLLRNDRNRGLTATLNRGVIEAQGDLIARMDADDIAAPRRLEMQVQALAEHPGIDAVGGGVEMIGHDGRTLRPRPVRCFTPGGARFMSLLGTPVAHVTLVARADLLRRFPYDESPQALHTEDYELFARILNSGVGIMNLREVLVTVRAEPRGVSLANEHLQVSNFTSRAREHFERTLGYVPPEPVHKVLINRVDGSVTSTDLAKGLQLLDRVERVFLKDEAGAGCDIRRTSDLQRVDIIVQAAVHWAHLRASAAALAVQYRRRLLSPAARRYLASKLPARPVRRARSRTLSV
jgi:glycosyltransferase involved in cell wall biosynthesis